MMFSEKPTLTELLESTKNLIDNIKLYLDDSSENTELLDSQIVVENKKE